MCGIVGYIGNKKAKPILIESLLRLEYRGYDSAGIATIEKNGVTNVKDKGRVNDLLKLSEIDSLEGTIGIGHTRWATHGKPCKENSHPHFDNSGNFSVVHNGIIENYSDLRKFLKENGYNFLSETDTEVVPNLIHYFYSKSDKTDDLKLLDSIKSACDKLIGSFALGIISSYDTNSITVVRKDSPLVIGKGVNENFISSDIPAILSYTKDFYLLDDKEFAIISKDNVIFYDNDLKEIEKETKNISWNAGAIEKDGFEDFMLKEIHEQPKSIRETIGTTLQEKAPTSIEGLSISKEYLTKVDKIFIVACGTAMHAGLTGKTLMENLCNIPTEVDVASEFRYRNPIINEKTLCIFVTQSGETADTIAALKLAKSKGAKTIAISNVIGSSITREAEHTIYTHAGPEIAVASTKAYTSQIVMLSILAIYFSEILGINSDKANDMKKDILSLPLKVESVLKTADQIELFAKKVFQEKDMFFIGRGADNAVSLEGSLKLKEIAYVHSEAYASGELKHGPIALIEDDVTVICVLTNKLLIDKSISNIQEVVTRGAKTFVITNQELDHEFSEVVKIPDINYLISPILSVIPLQLFAYYVSKEKGLDVDKPRNLAKSVTVE